MCNAKIIKYISGIIVFLLLFCVLIIWGIYDVSEKFGTLEKWLCIGLCGLLTILCIAEAVRYIVKLNQIRKSFDDDFDAVIANCKEHCSAQHYFLKDCLVTFQIPKRIFYDDIVSVTPEKVYSKYKGRNYYIVIQLKNNNKIRLEVKASEEYEAASIIKRHNQNIIVNERIES